MCAAALQPLYGAALYTASKHAVLGLQRALSPVCTAMGIRSGSVHPWFAGKEMLPAIHKILLEYMTVS